MKKEMKKVPAVRFTGFTGDWEQRKYSNVINLISGQDFEPSQYNENKEGIPYLTGASCIENGHTVAVRWTQTPRCIAEKGDTVLVCKGSGYGTIAVVDQEKAHIARQFMAVKAIDGEIDKAFNYYLLYSVIESIKKDARGLIAGIARDAVLNQPVLIPNIDEQVKIAHSLTNLDNLITLHQRKSDQLKKLKAYFLQNLFPAKGEKVPKIRFKGFTGEWEERKLGDICKVSSGIMGDSKLNNGTYHLTKIETISDGFVDENRVGYLNQKPDESFRLQKGDILYSNINSISHIGKVAKYEGHSLLYHGINLLRLTPSEETDSDFLLYFLNTKGKKNWARSHANPAVNQASINKTLLETQEIMVCDMEEQKKIGAFFSIIKNHLILHQQKITQLQAVKKFLLQNLFV